MFSHELSFNVPLIIPFVCSKEQIVPFIPEVSVALDDDVGFRL